MRWISFMFILLVFTIVGSGNLMNYISLGELNIRPNLLIILLVFLSSYVNSRDATMLCFTIGFFADVSGSTVGPAMVAFGLWGYLYSTIKEMLVLSRMRYQALILFLFSAISLATIEALTFFKTGQSSPRVFYSVILNSLYTALVGPIIWKILMSISFIFGFTNPHKRR